MPSFISRFIKAHTQALDVAILNPVKLVSFYGLTKTVFSFKSSILRQDSNLISLLTLWCGRMI